MKAVSILKKLFVRTGLNHQKGKGDASKTLTFYLDVLHAILLYGMFIYFLIYAFFI